MAPCVPEQELRAYLLGELVEERAEEVARHLATCRVCDATAAQLDDSDDAILRSLRRALGHSGDTTVRGFPAGSDAAPPPRVGGYEVLGELGRGGMGVVYLARQARPERLVALKVVLGGAHAGTEEQARFLAEADAIARLSHPGIVQVFAAGSHDGLPFLALEYLPGGSLERQLAGQPQPPAQAAVLAETLARAVQHAHSQGVVHRDLKPANILLSAPAKPQAAEGAAACGLAGAKITDFGLARQGAGGLTQTGAVMGTPSYMAPEQAQGKKDIGPGTDVWALGAILYECLTGRPPFKAATGMETLALVLQEEPVPPRRFQPGVPRDLETVCLKCLEKDPQRRYPSAGELADDLARFLRREPVRARPIGWVQRTWRWARRHPARAGLAAALAILAVSAVAGGLWYQGERGRLALRRTSLERDVAEALREAEGHRRRAAALTDRPAAWRAALQEARSALRRAGALLEREADLAGEETSRQVRQAEAELAADERDRALLERFDEVLMEGAQADESRRGFRSVHFFPCLREALAAYGLPVGEDVGRAVALLGGRQAAVRVKLLAVLDVCLLHAPLAQSEARRWLQHVLELADTDPWRREARQMMLAGDARLRGLVGQAPVERQPPSFLITFPQALGPGGVHDAVALLRRAQPHHPADFWLNFHLAHAIDRSAAVAAPAAGERELTARQRDLLHDAARFYSVALSLRPQSAGVWCNLGVVLRELNDLDGAIACHKKAIHHDPRFAPAHSNLGVALRARNDLVGAIASYRKAIACDPGFAPAYHNLGNALRDRNDRAGAIACFREAIRCNPGCVEAYYNLGGILYERNEPAAAIACYQKAIRYDPYFGAAHFNLGVALLARGDEATAIACFKVALQRNPRCADAYAALGAILADRNEVDAAIACYRKAIEHDPRLARAHYRLGVALCARNDLTGATAHLQKAIENNPHLASAHNHLGLVRYAHNDVAGAIVCFRNAIAHNPRHAQAHYNLGVVLRRRNDVAGAIACFKQAIRYQRRYIEAHHNLGNILYDRNELAGASACYRKAIGFAPRSPLPHYALGRALLAQGRFAEARAASVRSLELFPPDHSVRPLASQQLKECDRLLALERKLGPVLEGQFSPASPEEALALARLCRHPARGLHAAAVRFYTEAFAARPDLAGDLQAGHRHAAARSAVSAAGKDNLDEPSRAQLRRQALTWLEADLAAWGKRLQDGQAAEARRFLTTWRTAPELAGVRGKEALQRLPREESKAWRELWEGLDALLGRPPQ
jgi:serine/threonine-protein kinase